MTQNICACPDPPGGFARCDPDQLAICRVKDGSVQTECVSPPPLAPMPEEARFLALANWAIKAIAGVPRAPDEQLDHRAMALLRESMLSADGQGTAEDVHGRQVAFRLPDSLQALVRRFDEGMGMLASSEVES